MNRATSALVEAVRDLGLSVVTADQGESVRIAGAADQFPGKLIRLQKALEEFDRTGAAKADNESLAQENERLKKAVDGMFRWMRGAGIDISDPYRILEESLGVNKHKEKFAFTYTPKNARSKKKPRKNDSGSSALEGENAEEELGISSNASIQEGPEEPLSQDDPGFQVLPSPTRS